MSHDVLDPDWITFVERLRGVIAKRSPGAPVVGIVCNPVGGTGFQIHVISHNLRDVDRIAIIGELIESLAKRRPDMKEVVELHRTFYALFEAEIDTQSVPFGPS